MGSPAFQWRTSSPGLSAGLLRASQKVTLAEDNLSPLGHIVTPATQDMVWRWHAALG